jgi:hypothetical protein
VLEEVRRGLVRQPVGHAYQATRAQLYTVYVIVYTDSV